VPLLLACDLALTGPHFFRLFGSAGLVDRSLLAASTREMPLSIWPLLERSGWTQQGSGVLLGLFVLTAGLAALSGFLRNARWCFPAAYLSYVALKHSVGLATYGVHEFLQIALFYLGLWAAVERHESLARWIALAFRAHLAMAYMFAGLSKATGTQWWSGEAAWRAFHRSEPSGFRIADLTGLGEWPWVFQVLSVGTLVVESLYALAFVPRLRNFVLGSLVAMHVGTVVFQGLLVFGPTLVAMNLFWWLSAREWDTARRARTAALQASGVSGHGSGSDGA